MLLPGQPAPWFYAASLSGNARFTFDTAAGRWVVMLLLGSGASDESQAALQVLARHRALFDDDRASFFGVTVDPIDAQTNRIARMLPGVRWFLDYDRRISDAYGATNAGDEDYAAHWLLLDPMLRVHTRAALADGEDIIAALQRALESQCEPVTAPVLVVPQVLSASLCRRLIELYEANGGAESGFMREVDGVTTKLHDPNHKRRADYVISDKQLVAELKSRLSLVLVPMIARAFQFNATRVERWIVACYDADAGGHFRAHRDNTTAGTAHRKFACTINLNADDYEGGDLRFPEFGRQTYRASTGGAVVFSCSLLHEAKPVTKGKRYAFLPFFYDDAGARIRERNLDHVAPELRNYRSGLPPHRHAEAVN